MNLIDSWLASEAAHGHNSTESLAIINLELGTAYKHSKLSEWRRGIRKPSASAMNYMLVRAIPFALSEYATVDELVQALTLNEV
jgi:hypothetical protein